MKKLSDYIRYAEDVINSPKWQQVLHSSKSALASIFAKDKNIKIWKYSPSRREFLRNVAIFAGVAYIWDKLISCDDKKKPRENSIDDPSFIHHFIDKDMTDKLPKTWNEEFDNFWSNPDYFINVPKDDNIESRALDNWYFIKDDAWLKFWAVQESQLADIDDKQKIYNENIKNKKDKKSKRDIIIEELSEFEEFEYLRWSEYKEKIRSFNTSNWEIPVNASMPIPMKTELRQFTNEYFMTCCKLWIETLLKHPKYWPKIKDRINWIWIDEFAKNLTALARNESTIPGENIWYYEYHRYEWSDKKYSYSPFHILMREWEPWFDGKKELWLSEWQTYHPFFASMLVCLFLCNKKITRKWARKLSSATKEKWSEYVPLINFFPIREETKDIIAYLYNWPRYKTTWQNYHQRLLDNLESL